jgi:hypothetical protein
MGANMPDHAWAVPEEEREQRVQLTTDTCVLDNEHYFIRGLIGIPVHDYPDVFGFGVWVSQKRENFLAYRDNQDSAEIGPFFGWLSTAISYYREDTINLKTMAHFKGEGLRPSIELEETDHPLSLDQRRGITLDKAWEIVHFYMNSAGEDV